MQIRHRGTRAHPLLIGDHVLIGPHAYLTGYDIGDEVFIATGAMIFNGARMALARHHTRDEEVTGES